MINYEKYTNEIINMMFNSDDLNSDEYFFNKCNKIGKEIVTISGNGKNLFTLMDILVDKLSNEYSSEYLGALRLVEVAFNGSSNEWQM
jgi:hypothetical protein